MSSQTKYAVPPIQRTGFSIFVRSAYIESYNFAVANYNAVSVTQKSTMFGGLFLLFRSVVAVVWIASIACAVLTLIKSWFLAVTIVLGLIYIAISIYNIYVFITNHSLLSSSRFLSAKYGGPSGHDYEWVAVPLDSRSGNERLSAVEQSALDNVRRDYAGNNKVEIDCMVYTKRYVTVYTTFPKEIILHILLFLISIAVGIFMSTI